MILFAFVEIPILLDTKIRSRKRLHFSMRNTWKVEKENESCIKGDAHRVSQKRCVYLVNCKTALMLVTPVSVVCLSQRTVVNEVTRRTMINSLYRVSTSPIKYDISVDLYGARGTNRDVRFIL